MWSSCDTFEQFCSMFCVSNKRYLLLLFIINLWKLIYSIWGIFRDTNRHDSHSVASALHHMWPEITCLPPSSSPSITSTATDKGFGIITHQCLSPPPPPPFLSCPPSLPSPLPEQIRAWLSSQHINEHSPPLPPPLHLTPSITAPVQIRVWVSQP